MYVSYDPQMGATYVEWADGLIARTVSVGDLIMVDVDEYDQPLGVEFVVPPQQITPEMLVRLTAQFPTLKDLHDTSRWLSTAV